MKALVIDDSTAARYMLTKMLEELGCVVVQAADGQQALEQLKQNSDVTFALVDWNMPVMNGLEFVVEARKQRAYDGIKLMMVTTETEMTNIVQALEAGAQEYVMKPFTKQVIEQKLNLLGISATA